MISSVSSALRPALGLSFALIALSVSVSVCVADEKLSPKGVVPAGGSLIDRSSSVLMAIDDPIVQRQMRLQNRPSNQAIKKEKSSQSVQEVRIEIPPGSLNSGGKENTSPFFQFRQLQETPQSSESDGQFLSQEARKNQVERYRQSLVSVTD
jgi:hypothetical protein